MTAFILSSIIVLSFILTGLHFIKKSELNFIEKLLFSFTISVFIFINISIFFLITGFYSKKILSGLLFIFFITGLPNILFLKHIFFKIKNFILNNKIFSFILVCQLFFHLIGSVSFPLGEDALSYHLTLPKIFLQNHKFIDRPDILNSTFPLNSELLYSIGIILNRPEIAKLFNWFFYIFLLVLIYVSGIKLFNNSFISKIAVTIFLITPSLIRIVGYCKNDIIFVFFTSLTFYLLHNILKGWQKIYSIIFILSLSLLLGIKYNALIILLIIIIINVLLLIKNKFKTNHLKLFLFIITAVIISSFWFIKNYYYTSNPVFPFLDKHFNPPNKKFNSSNIAASYNNPVSIQHYATVRKYKRNIKNTLLFFYNISLNFQYFDYWKYAIGPFYLIIFILLFFNIKSLTKTELFLLFAFFFYASCIFYFAPRGRLLLPLLPLLAIALSKTLYFHITKYKSIKIVFVILFSITILINLGLTFSQHIFRIKYLLGMQSKDDYIRSRLYYYRGFYDTVKFANSNLNPEKDKILLMINKEFLLDIPFITGFDFMHARYIIPFNKLKTSMEFYSILRQLKLNYILYLKNDTRFINKKFFIFVKELQDKKLTSTFYKNEDTLLLKINR